MWKLFAVLLKINCGKRIFGLSQFDFLINLTEFSKKMESKSENKAANQIVSGNHNKK